MTVAKSGSAANKSSPLRDPVEQYNARLSIFENFSREVSRILDSALRKAGTRPQSVTWRAKDATSFRRKLEVEEGRYNDPLSQVTDLAGVRVIVYYPSDVDKVANLVEENFLVDRANTEDKRKPTDPTHFGYASLHYVVQLTPDRVKLVDYRDYEGLKCEIQIRTVLQHAWAEIEHDTAYKSTVDIPFELRRNFASIAALIELVDQQFEVLTDKARNIQEKVGKEIEGGRLEAPIDSESLVAYLKKKHLGVYPLYDESITGWVLSDVVSECIETGIKTLEDFDKAVRVSPAEKIERAYKDWRRGDLFGGLKPMNSMTAIRSVLMYNNPEKFMEFVREKRSWGKYYGVLQFYERIGRLRQSTLDR